MQGDEEPRSGWYIEFTRGWWRKSNGRAASERQQVSGTYHGSVTDEQAREVETIVKDYLTAREQPPRLTAYGMRDFVARAIAYWEREHGERAAKEAEELKAMLAGTRSATRTFAPTHRHADGGLYRLVSQAKYKSYFDKHWSDAVVYESEDRSMYVTTPARWSDRFAPLSKVDSTDAP